jgi:hypothetical protein
MLMLTGGGEACADIERLRAQSALFGSVPSDSTLYRTFRSISPEILSGLWEAVAEVRAKVWRRRRWMRSVATRPAEQPQDERHTHDEHAQVKGALRTSLGVEPVSRLTGATVVSGTVVVVAATTFTSSRTSPARSGR